MRRLPRKLDPHEVRVLGVLLEKEQATPDYYPMTVNSVTQGCNQKTNREPVMRLSQSETQASLDRLFNEDVFAWRSRMGRTTKWKQNVDRRWQLSPPTKAIMTLLLLRGPQTAGELRARSDRLHQFADLAEVEEALAALSQGEEPLVTELERAPGQKENRWAHLVGSLDLTAPAPAPALAGEPARPEEDRLAALESRVAALETQVQRWITEDRERP